MSKSKSAKQSNGLINESPFPVNLSGREKGKIEMNKNNTE